MYLVHVFGCVLKYTVQFLGRLVVPGHIVGVSACQTQLGRVMLTEHAE